MCGNYEYEYSLYKTVGLKGNVPNRDINPIYSSNRILCMMFVLSY